MEYEKCYVFEPEAKSRPLKRRKTEPQGLHASWELRKRAYREAWDSQKKAIDNALRGVHEETLNEITTFLDEQTTVTRSSTRIPTGIILTGPGGSSQRSLAGRVAETTKQHGKRIHVDLDSTATANLKAALKHLIQRGTSATHKDDDEDDDAVAESRKGRRLLNYDLQILAEHVRERNIEQVVLAIYDTEAIASDVLSELVEILGSWYSRIPLVCLFNVATSVDFLQQRLSQGAIQCLDGRLFDAVPSSAEVQLIFSKLNVGVRHQARLGPAVFSAALERQSDFISSADSLVDMVKYAHMSHYYANPLSIFLNRSLKLNDLSQDHFDALRNVGSFREHVKNLLDAHALEEVRALLDDNAALLEQVHDGIEEGLMVLGKMNIALDVVRAIQTHLPGANATMKTSLYIQAVSGKLAGSTLIRNMLLSVRKAPSDVFTAILDAVTDIAAGQADSESGKSHLKLLDLQAKLVQLSADSKQGPKQLPLRSEDEIGSSTMRTTVVAQKVQLSKQKAQLSKQDAAYTALVRSFTDELESYFTEVLVDVKKMPFHEIVLYDLKSPHKETFTPRPRHAIERALATPHDYLACQCCGSGNEQGDDASLSSTQPATAVLYQLYLESGSLINVSDLWQAFQAVMGEKEDEEKLMALFQRALAEMRYLGLVKSTRKKADHIAKVAWKGL